MIRTLERPKEPRSNHDRLARPLVHQALLVEEPRPHGAEVVFLDRPMGRDLHDRLLLQLRGAAAEYERKLCAGVLLPWTRPPYGSS